MNFKDITLGLLATLLVGSLIVLQYGNPQWNRAIYIWQCYILKRGVPPHSTTSEIYLYPPADFDGVWFLWHRNGSLNGVEQVKGGRFHGYMTFFEEDGSMRGTTIFRDDQFLCVSPDEMSYINGLRIVSDQDFDDALEKAKKLGLYYRNKPKQP